MTPWPRSHQDLPSTDHLCESPELAALAVLQTSLRITSQVLDIQHPELGTRHHQPEPPESDELLAQLIIDRCRELSELVTNYRRVLHPDSHPLRRFDDFPF